MMAFSTVSDETGADEGTCELLGSLEIEAEDEEEAEEEGAPPQEARMAAIEETARRVNFLVMLVIPFASIWLATTLKER